MRKNGEEFEAEFEARVRMEQRQRSSRSVRTSSIAFRAPQENFTLDDFDLEKAYGFGSYSKVIMAKKKDTGHVYALKIMDKKFISKENKAARVKLERILLDQLDHSGVTKLFFTFQDNYSLHMALESCEGGDLFDQINRNGRLSENEARFYAAELIDALEYIHGLGLIHQDIKPENLLLSADGHIKIADFGSVTPTSSSPISALPEATKAKADDKTCAFVGTAAYVSPEALNSAPATFGFGVMLHPHYPLVRDELEAIFEADLLRMASILKDVSFPANSPGVEFLQVGENNGNHKILEMMECFVKRFRII